ncbi:MAG: DNA repair protein RecO [Clostridiales bacterium]|nr:DNA repair protein RecO [Clostridiales bacterium]
MITDTEALVLRQIKTASNRRMIVLLTQRFGKVSAGTSISERGRTKAALAIRPFCYGRYELYKSRGSYNINSAQTIQSFFGIGGDVDKYMYASYALELADKLLPEEQPAPAMLNLLRDLLGMLDERKSAYGTLVAAFQVRALQISGNAPVLSNCVRCGAKENLTHFCIKDGGCVCENCAREASHEGGVEPLDEEMLPAMQFMQQRPIRALEGIGLTPENESSMSRLLRSYIAYHLGVENLKSEEFLKQ